MARKRNVDLFDDIKRIVKDQTEELGDIVGNLHGVASVGEEADEAALRAQRMLVTTLDATSRLSFSAAIDQFTEDRPSYELREFSGILRVQDASGLTLLLGSISLPSARQVRIGVSSPESDIGIYIGGASRGSGRGEVVTSPYLESGTHVIALLVYGDDPITAVFPTDVAISFVSPTPPPPPVAEGQFYEIDPELGLLLNEIRWGNHMYATAWEVYRSAGRKLGNVVSSTGTLEELVVTIDQPIEEEADTIYTEAELPGLVVDWEVVGQTTEITIIASGELEDWEEGILWASDTFSSVGKVTYAGDGGVVFEDKAVQRDRIYVYQVTAIGMTGDTESDYSSPVVIFTNDNTPPGDVEDLIVTPEGSTAHISYIAPSDPDFSGVHLLDSQRNRLRTHYGQPGERDQFSVRLDDEGTYWIVTFDALKNVQEVGVSFEFAPEDVVTMSPPILRAEHLGNQSLYAEIKLTARSRTNLPVAILWKEGAPPSGDYQQLPDEGQYAASPYSYTINVPIPDPGEPAHILEAYPIDNQGGEGASVNVTISSDGTVHTVNPDAARHESHY